MEKCNGLGREPGENPTHYDRAVARWSGRLTLAMCVLALGCGSDGSDEPPTACPRTSDEVLSALRAAPGAVRAAGAPLSRCLARRSDAGDVQQVGVAYVEAAATLSAQVRDAPEGRAAVRLGYLVGAAHRGSGSTQGIHTELVRRLEQELEGLPRSRALRKGMAAGRRSG
jgi:hypothetical protein